MNNHQFVFLDRQGKRWRWTRVALAVAVVAALSALVVFFRALWVKPELHMPASLRTMKVQLKAMAKSQPPAPAGSAVKPWTKFQKPQPAPPKAATGSKTKIVAALLGNGDARSLHSLAAHASQLTHVCPDMMTATGVPAELHVSIEDETLAAVRASRLALVPMLTNLEDDHWDTDAIEGLLQSDAEGQDAFVDKIRAALDKAGAAGVLIDWQGIDPAFAGKLVDFLRHLRDALHTDGRELWLSIPVGDDLHAFDLDHLPAVVDRLVAQLHDENAEDDAPGPVASQPWFEGWLRTLMGYGDSRQWILSLGAYGYDWNKSTGKATMVSFPDIMARAQQAGSDGVTSSAPDFSPGFGYDLEGEWHEVWFLDATTFANQLRSVDEEGCAGIMLNSLGNEDPGVWSVLASPNQDKLPAPVLRQLESLTPGQTIAQIGTGDFLTADLGSAGGARQVWRDNIDGAVSETFKKWPVYPTITHVGNEKPRRVAITFDDGPDPEWTPKILDILRQHKVHATFFLVGRNAEDYPGLVRRIVKEGHEIGSHTYTHANLAEAGDEQTVLELNATQRLIEWITGRATILFRPPYNADSMPASLVEAEPIAKATELGYLTVGESIDPQDWARPGTEEIVRRVRDQRAEGNIILLHDAGGDRSQTVEALPRILDFLQERGDTIVPAGHLIGLHREQTMPPHSETASGPRLIANLGLLTWHWAEEFLWAFMIVTSLLTLARSIFLAFLALRKRPVIEQTLAEPLSVVIAAYNEEKVIAATLRSVLKTEYRGDLEVIVVDDGSTDETSREAAALNDPRVRVLRQANGGKSAALAHGVSVARHEIVVFLDADTQFQADTLDELVKPLSDPKVGAVSGHARVGNLKTWIARCQSLEYICGFNLDRRAYDALNAITVVPGAISALRKDAIADAGGFASDTLAEDTDLTLSLHRAGWRVTYAPAAIAWTEAPETVGTLAKQRFRWAFGTMQCVWKHRDMLLNPKFGALGCFSLPSIVFFQVLLVATIPIVDLLLIISLICGAGTPFVLYFLAFLLCDLALALLACGIEKEPLAQATRIIPMRFVYRPILSFVVWRSILRILRGAWVGWGKLERKGSVATPAFES